MPMPGLKYTELGNRKSYEVKLPAFREISYIGFDIFTSAGKLARHQHKGMFEFSLIMRGDVTWWARERIYDLRGGDIYVTWPDEPHGGLNELMHPCTIYWMALKIPKIPKALLPPSHCPWEFLKFSETYNISSRGHIPLKRSWLS